ncbi:hypothetical protein BDV18DRAFT_130436 [Aspergillus unguis]
MIDRASGPTSSGMKSLTSSKLKLKLQLKSHRVSDDLSLRISALPLFLRCNKHQDNISGDCSRHPADLCACCTGIEASRESGSVAESMWGKAFPNQCFGLIWKMLWFVIMVVVNSRKRLHCCRDDGKLYRSVRRRWYGRLCQPERCVNIVLKP